MRKIALAVLFLFALAAAPPPVHAQKLGDYAFAHGYRASFWKDFSQPGYVTVGGLLNPAVIDISTPAGFNARYGGGALVNMTCGSNWTQGAGRPFRAVGTTAACLTACNATCSDGAASPMASWGSCAQVCVPRWIPPYSNKGTIPGERASKEAIEAFYRSVGITGSATDLDLNDAKMIANLYDGLIDLANGGVVTPPPATTNPNDPGANAVPINDRSQPCGLFQSTMSGALRWYRNLSAPPNCVSATTTPPVTLPPTTPTPPTTLPPATTTCAAWKAKAMADLSAMPGCATTLPPGAIIFSSGIGSTGATQFVVVP